MSAGLWAVVFAIVVPILLQLLKKYATVIQNNKALVRVIVIVLSVVGAVSVQLTTTGTVNWDVVMQSAAITIGGAELEYQWLLKYLESLAKKG